MVMKVDAPHKTVTISCAAIAGYMEAMVMPFTVRETKELEGLAPGVTVSFTLVVEKETSHPENLQVLRYQGLEVDPLTARRLRLMNQTIEHSSATAAIKPLAIGDRVPDFKLLDQNGRRVALSKFAGKVVALNFIYTRCALPDFCFRSSNHFRQLQKRFQKQLGYDLVLVTVTFDPAHDRPDVLLKYAAIWKADARSWRFLTGSASDVQHVCSLFSLDAFQDEGLMNHSLHTAIIDRNGTLVANIEGNQFTAEQLGDLVQTFVGRQ
jgi:protein SCO1/2